ncbi:MAG: hypothetical protein WA771_04535 [Chthoniobacterales bacterium]
MSVETVEYARPTARSFSGMQRILFQPFSLSKWLILGFTAWLAGLLDGGGSGSIGGSGSDGSGKGGLTEKASHFGDWVTENLGIVIGIGSVVLIVALAAVVALLWVSSRGKFMFLDNVVQNRAEVKTPWKRFRPLGNSLFRWKLVFGLIAFAAVFLIVGVAVPIGFLLPESAWMVFLLAALAILPVVLVFAYVSILLEDFVIPLMYRSSLTTNQAWRQFFPLHRRSITTFILYALWKVLLWIPVSIFLILLGVATCCVGFVLLAIPYVGAVFLLPISVFFRLLGPEFLKQFGPDLDVFPQPASAVGDPPPLPGGV